MKKWKTPFYILVHPIEGFEELRYHKWGSIKVATALVFLLFVTLIVNRQLSGFSFTINTKLDELNIPLIFAESVGLCLGFAIINWAICTLFDGNARIQDIWISIGYALLPYIIATLFVTILSWFFTINEAVFLLIFQQIGLIYTLFLLLKGLEAYHEYSFKSAVLSAFMTVIGILLLIFICILLFSIAQQFVAFIVTIWQELALRR